MAQCEEGTDGEWVDVEFDSINVGDRVRGRFEDEEDGSARRTWSEGVVSRKLDHALQLEGFSYYYDSSRTWQRLTPATVAPRAGSWVQVLSSRRLRSGERARGESRTSGQVREGVVREVTHQGHVMFEGQTAAAGSSRRWSRWVPAPVAPSTSPPTFAAPRVGDRFNRTYAHAERATRENCEATRVAPRREGGWIVRYSWGGYNYTSDVSADGFITSGVAGRYELVSSAPAVESRPATSTPLPEWAVGLTLEQARKYIHDEARRLYRRGSNCHSGTRDFLRAARLPSDPDRAYPEPQAVDESERVRAFLAGVRLDALSTAEDHGKSISEVEGYLTAIGLTAPRPAHEDHTVNIRVPIGANVTQVLRDLGWEVR